MPAGHIQPGYQQASPAVPGQKSIGHERQGHQQRPVLPQQQLPPHAGASQTTAQQYMSSGQSSDSPQIRPVHSVQAANQPSPQTPSNSRCSSQMPQHQGQQTTQPTT